MGFRGGGQIDPPQHILVFKYPTRDRVKFKDNLVQLTEIGNYNKETFQTREMYSYLYILIY